ncbi:hypothetical protein CAEBREN_28591 [Caenorhabditis brenneri]|uniref:Uncharacterized protein n=1 Tax=Caenorhabditis brenneri TaxID=135651 RepID=G0M6Z3_CAEBE|nr:hypothetical protein CAEBREN_28591 [Caenorhabditis brenneri]
MRGMRKKIQRSAKRVRFQSKHLR